MIKQFLFVAIFSASACVASAASKLVMQDHFESTTSGWPHHNADSDHDLGFSVYQDGGGYQLTPVKDHVFGFVAAPRQADSANVRMQAALFLYAGIGAGAGGLACRVRDFENFYAFLGMGNSTVAIVRVRHGKPKVLAQTSIESIVEGSVDTTMTAECQGKRLSLRATGASQLTAEDDELPDGKTGLVVLGEKTAGTSAAFKQFALFDLGDALGQAR